MTHIHFSQADVHFRSAQRTATAAYYKALARDAAQDKDFVDRRHAAAMVWLNNRPCVTHEYESSGYSSVCVLRGLKGVAIARGADLLAAIEDAQSKGY